MHAFHATACRIQRRADLRQHAAGQRAVFHHVVDLLRCDTRNQLAGIVKYARRVGQQDQFFSLEDFGDLAGDYVGVDVVGFAVLADTNRRDHRDEAAGFQMADQRRVDLHDVADLADVDHLVRLVLVLQQQFLGADEIAVLAGQSDSLATGVIDQVDHVLVDLTAEHHFNDFHRLCIGHAHALDELALLTDARQQVLDLRPAAMHDHHVHADQLEQHHVAREALFQIFVGHRIAAVFDDDGSAVKLLDVRQRLGEDRGFVGGGDRAFGHGGDP